MYVDMLIAKNQMGKKAISYALIRVIEKIK